MAYLIPDSTEFKAYFVRDFPFGTDPEIEVLDSDITKAIAQARFNVYDGIFADQSQFTIGYLYMAAHYLLVDLKASSQGIAGNYSFLTQSKTVGSVSESYAIPQRILDNPLWSMISKTPYGAKYLSLVWPKLQGVMFGVCGRTHP